MTERVFQQVPYDKISEYEKDGWIVVDDFAGLHHGYYAVLMEKIVEDVSDRQNTPNSESKNST